MKKWTERTAGETCIAQEDGDDAYSTMYRLNEAYKYVTKAGELLEDCVQLN
jgi:hypothetical protein